MSLKTQLQLRNFILNFMEVLLQFGSFEIHFMKIQLFQIINFFFILCILLQFQDIFTQKYHIIVKFYVTT